MICHFHFSQRTSKIFWFQTNLNDDEYLTEEEERVWWCQVIREEEPLHHVGVHVGGRRSPGII